MQAQLPTAYAIVAIGRVVSTARYPERALTFVSRFLFGALQIRPALTVWRAKQAPSTCPGQWPC